MPKELNFKKNRPESKWLNDEDIGNFYKHITANYSVEKGSILLFENAFILGNLVELFNNRTPIGRSANGLIKRIKANKFVFVPASRENTHWTLFIYDKEHKTFHHYNSYKNVNNLQYFRPFLKSNNLGVELAKNEINFEEHKTPQQDNGDDCGLYVIAITELLVRRYQENSVMDWEINDEEAEEIKKNVPIFRKMLEEGKNYFADLIVETTQKKKQKLVRVHQIITNAQNILDKNGVTKEELESVIKDLKTLANAVVDSTEEIVWTERKIENEKLLNGLLNKLSALSTTPNEIPTPPASPNSDELKNTADDNDKLKEKAEASQPQVQKDQETIKNNLNDDIKQAQSGTDDDKVEVVKNAGKIHGEEGFEKQKTQIEAIKEELIQNNPVKYREGIIGEIEENMKKNNLSSEELDKELETEWQKIKKGEIKEPTQLKELERKINENIGKIGAKKKFQKLKKKLSKATKASKEKLKKWKAKIMEIIYSKNKYEQEYKAEAQDLLVQLENSQIKNSKLDNKFPVGLAIGGGAIVLTLIVALIVIKKRKKTKINFLKNN